MTVTNQTLPTIAPQRRLQLSRQRSLDGIRPDLRIRLGELVRGDRRWPLYLYGTAGSGKSCASLAMCDFAATAAYFCVDTLCDRILEGDTEVFESIANKDLAVLDEVGAREKVSELHYSAVKRFADAREGKPTIYVSNIHPKDLVSVYDDRVYSRLSCGTWFELCEEVDRRAK